MLRSVALVRTDVSEELRASFIRVTRIGEIGKLIVRSVRRLLVTANVPSSQIHVTLMMEVIPSSETSVLTRAIRRNIPKDGILRDKYFNSAKHRNDPWDNEASYLIGTGDITTGT
jgi:hypothetical protein